jgi:murein peptide amidase A
MLVPDDFHALAIRAYPVLTPLLPAIEAGILECRGLGEIKDVNARWPLPVLVQRGATAGSMEPLRLAVFALVHGDEPAGVESIVRLLRQTVGSSELLRGVELFCYPVCNPVGFAAGTRCNGRGLDLNREFWRDSSEPEVRALEAELRTRRFDGLIALHADCDSHGLYAFARGAVTSQELVAPALRAAEGVLPRNTDAVIDGFVAEHGVICDCYPGVLAPPPGQSPAPFEIILETPGTHPIEEQAEAGCRALLGLLAELPRLSIGGPDI